MQSRRLPQRRPSRRYRAAVPVSPAVSADVLRHLGDYIRALWIVEMRTYLTRMTRQHSTYGEQGMEIWDGEEDQFGRRRAPVWPALARFCLTQQLEPREWIRTLFATFKAGASRNPSPPDLMQPKTVTEYSLRSGDILRVAALSFDLQKTAAARKISELSVSCMRYTPVQALRNTLLDRDVNLTPLYRLCLAYAGGQMDLVDRFYLDGLVQYFFDRDRYDAIWGVTIPQDLRASADNLRGALSLPAINTAYTPSSEGI